MKYKIVIRSDEFKAEYLLLREFYFKNKLHREDGPAIEWEDDYKEWWINGNYFTEAEFNTHKP